MHKYEINWAPIVRSSSWTCARWRKEASEAESKKFCNCMDHPKRVLPLLHPYSPFLRFKRNYFSAFRWKAYDHLWHDLILLLEVWKLDISVPGVDQTCKKIFPWFAREDRGGDSSTPCLCLTLRCVALVPFVSRGLCDKGFFVCVFNSV